jgi:hypothetical protein
MVGRVYYNCPRLFWIHDFIRSAAVPVEFVNQKTPIECEIPIRSEAVRQFDNVLDLDYLSTRRPIPLIGAEGSEFRNQVFRDGDATRRRGAHQLLHNTPLPVLRERKG